MLKEFIDFVDYVANAVVNLMLPDTESTEKVYEKGTKRFCDKFHSFFEEVVAEAESAMYDLAMRETMPEAISAKKEKKEKAEAEIQFPQTFEF
jgi:trimethylamine:corrinoid methyltransferase-like protein